MTNNCYGILSEKMLETRFQHMVKGSKNFPVYHYDTPPHKATGNKGNGICEIISSLEIVFGMKSGLRAGFKQPVPQQSSILR